MSDKKECWATGDVSVIILGAGFSAAVTNGKMPLMGNFFEGINRSKYQSLIEFIESIEGDINKANVENILLTLEQIRTSPDSLANKLGLKSKQQYSEINQQLTHYILERLQTGCHVTPDNWAVQILAGASEKTTVISMNYDNIAERILSKRRGLTHHGDESNCPHCKMRMILEKSCNCSSREAIGKCDWEGALLKPHGSIAWRRCLNPDCCSYECLVADKRCRPFEACYCPQCNTECAPAIVLPSMSKNLEKIPEIQAMWNASYDAISEAESILVFGFSFPQSDALFTQLVRKAICTSPKLREFAIIDLNPDDIFKRFEKCIKTNHNVYGTCFPVIKNEPPEWLVSS